MYSKAILTGLCVFIAVGGVYAADNSAALLHPDSLRALTLIKGKVQSVDESSRRLTVVDSSSQTVTVIVTPDTAVSDSENRAFNWMSLHAGDPVVIYYEPKEHVALQIDRQTTAVESVLNIDHPETK